MFEIHEEIDGYLERYCFIAFHTKEDAIEYLNENGFKYDEKEERFYKQIGFSINYYYIKELKVYKSNNF